MPRPRLQDIADRTGLSKMTVSRALRGERHVSQDVAQQVRSIADELGYRPDPEISKLMSHMRRSRRADAPRTLGFVWADYTAPEISQSPWSSQLVIGARRRALQLGFSLEEFYLAERGMSPARVSAIMEARGIPGFILSPLVSRSRGHVSMRWEKFSSTVIGLGFARPPQHRVHHHHFLGMMTAMRQLKKLGYRRIGFVASTTIDQRMFGAWSASFLAHHPLPISQAEKLLLLRREPSRAIFQQWLQMAEPDAVIDFGHTVWPWLKNHRIPQEIGYVTLNWQPGQSSRSGIDQQADVLGAAAVDLVVEQYHHNERGTPLHPKIVMTEGTWKTGQTTCRRCR